MFVAAKSDLASFKEQINEIDIYQVKSVPAELSQLSNVVDNDVSKNCVW